MPIFESKNREGLLTFNAGSTDPAVPAIQTASQTTNVSIQPKRKEDDKGLEVLSGEVLAGEAETSWTLKGKQLQDFENPEGIQAWSWENDGTTVPFEWLPNGTGTGKLKITGNVVVAALEVGGDVGKRLSHDLDWPIVGKPTWTYQS